MKHLFPHIFTAALAFVVAPVSAFEHAPDLAVGYWEAKAQCWAALAGAEASQGDVRGTAAISSGNAERIREALSTGRAPDDQAEQPIHTRELLPSADPNDGRPAWRQDIERVKDVLGRYRERLCLTPVSACLEVAQASVWENMEETEGARWNHGRPEIDRAISLAGRAEAEIDDLCPAPKTLNGIDVAAAVALATVELPTDALFRFDMADARGLLPGAHSAIAAIATKARGYGSAAASIEVVGHTDRLGTEAYNASLSTRRALTVAGLLRQSGVELPITTRGAGTGEPVTGEKCTTRLDQAALIGCLQPDRRVVVRILPAAPSMAP